MGLVTSTWIALGMGTDLEGPNELGFSVHSVCLFYFSFACDQVLSNPCMCFATAHIGQALDRGGCSAHQGAESTLIKTTLFFLFDLFDLFD